MEETGSIKHCRITISSLLLLTSLLAAGCADLQAVRTFAKTSAATADYRQIVNDYVESPTRQQRYLPDRYAAQLARTTAKRAGQKTLLEGSQRVLAGYLNALGDLAADDLPDVDSEIDGLAKALDTAGFAGYGDAAIRKETATAAGRIAKVLTRAVLDHWRQYRVQKIITETDGNVQAVAAGLREIMLKDFNASLDIEAEAVRKYFESSIAAAKSRNDAEAVPPLARILLQEHLDRIRERRDRLSSYAEILEKIGKGHADLLANVDKLEDKALQKRLEKFAEDLRILYKAMQEIAS